MTVSSLWKALDRAGSGRCVGVKELQNHHGFRNAAAQLDKTNPWNIRQVKKQQGNNSSYNQRPVLAVDLSIWICEALTSSAMQQNHVVDPAVQLVYSRTLKLLNLGIKLVVVVEGKRRIRRTAGAENDVTDDPVSGKQPPQQQPQDKFRKRRSGAPFWTACQRCETVLKALGVPVVRAKAEGEALCALLNQKGIVDGVISNDGDCFLFGAKVLYTKFSIDNLEQSRVVRYDADDIRACLDDDDADNLDDTGELCENGNDIVKMTRDDLIAFAILTGSDLAGDGLDKVGCRKAIRFIRKCRIDNPLKLDESPAIKELLAWSEAAARTNSTALFATVGDDDCEGGGKKTTTCGCCGHPGNKKSHKKHGCGVCGTEPGEACFPLSPGAKFRKSLRSKALDMGTSFDPSSTIELYNQPNENQLPLLLVGKSSRNLEMQAPQLQALLRTKFIIRGGSLHESRQYIQRTVSAYMARTALFVKARGKPVKSGLSKLPKNSNRPTPVRINKFVTRSGVPSCEVQWVIKATLTDEEGNPIDNLEFSTIEDQSLIQDTYPDLLLNFKGEVKTYEAQGSAEQEKRQAFIASMFANGEKERDPEKIAKKLQKPRKSLNSGPVVPEEAPQKVKGRSDDLKTLLFDVQKAARSRPSSGVQKQRGKQLPKRRSSPSENDADKGIPKVVKAIGSEDRANSSDGRQIAMNADGKVKPSKKDAFSEYGSCGDDIAKMLYAERQGLEEKRNDDSTINSASMPTLAPDIQDRQMKDIEAYRDEVLTPGHIHFLNSNKSTNRPAAFVDSREKEFNNWSAMPRGMCDIAEDPFDPSIHENDTSPIDHTVKNPDELFRAPTDNRSDEYYHSGILPAQPFMERQRKEERYEHRLDAEKENQYRTYETIENRPQSFGGAMQKRQRQTGRTSAMGNTSSIFAMERQESIYARQEKKDMMRSYSRSPLLKKRRDAFQSNVGMFDTANELWPLHDNTFPESSLPNSSANPFDAFGENTFEDQENQAPYGNFEPIDFGGTQKSRLQNYVNHPVEASHKVRSENRRPHSSSSVQVRKHSLTPSIPSRRPFSSQPRNHGAVFQDRTNTWGCKSSDYDISFVGETPDLANKDEWCIEDDSHTHDFIPHRQSVGKPIRNEQSNWHDAYQADEWQSDNPFNPFPDGSDDFRQPETQEPSRMPTRHLQQQQRDREANREWVFQDETDFAENYENDYMQPHRRQTKNRSRRSRSRDSSHRKLHHDNIFMPGDFDEPNVSEDPFISSVVERSYFDHRDENPPTRRRSGRRHAHREPDQPLDSRDDDDLDMEARRRVEKKMEYTRRQAVINELLTENVGNVGFGYHDDGW
ncbi:MAG: hypothetical protein SGILL_004126 [Bacillariaceae sp.]